MTGRVRRLVGVRGGVIGCIVRTAAALSAISTDPGWADSVSPPLPSTKAGAVGELYTRNDLEDLDSRQAAVGFMNGLRGAGYSGVTHQSGQDSELALEAAKALQVVGYFGHSAPGEILTQMGASKLTDEKLFAGTSEGDKLFTDDHYASWMRYKEFVDVDDLRLAILGGCKTSAKTDSGGSFETIAKVMGIDAIVTFSDLVVFPTGTAGSASANTHGNYFATRLGVYLSDGMTISRALASARTDMIGKHGSAEGWGSYRVTGSVSSPGAVTVTPAGNGQLATSQPTAYLPAPSISALPVRSSTTLSSGEVYQVLDHFTVRRQPDGSLIDIVGTAEPTSGDPMSMSEAVRIATDFMEANAPAGARTVELAAASPISHGDGQSLALVEWADDAHRVTAEVDRRSGGIVYFSLAEAPAFGDWVLSSSEAVAIVRSMAASDEIVSAATPLYWRRPMWIVTTRDATADSTSAARWFVDAGTGQVLDRAAS